LKQEFAGLGGDVGFFKNEVEAQANLPLWTTTDPATGETFSDIVLQVKLFSVFPLLFHSPSNCKHTSEVAFEF
jgi:hypothetical protein